MLKYQMQNEEQKGCYKRKPADGKAYGGEQAGYVTYIHTSCSL